MLLNFVDENSKILFKKTMSKASLKDAVLQPIVIKGDANKETGEIYPFRIRTKVMKNLTTNTPDITIQSFEGEDLPVNSWEDIEKVVLPVIPKGKALRSFILLKPYFIIGSSKIGISFKLCTVQADTKKIPFQTSFKFDSSKEKVNLYKAPSIINDDEIKDSDDESD